MITFSERYNVTSFAVGPRDRPRCKMAGKGGVKIPKNRLPSVPTQPVRRHEKFEHWALIRNQAWKFPKI